MVLSLRESHGPRKTELYFNFHTMDFSKEPSERTPRLGITDPSISLIFFYPKASLPITQDAGGPGLWLRFLRLVQTPSICLPSFYLNILLSSKITQALHRARDRYKFTPNVQRQDKWVTPEGLLCLPGAGHPPSALWICAPPGLTPTGFLSLLKHFSFLILGRGKGWHWGRRQASM